MKWNKLYVLTSVLLSLFLLFGNKVLGQGMTVNNSSPYNGPMWLVQHVLVDTSYQGVFPAYSPPLSGIPLTQPNSTQIGYFNAAGTGFPIDSGIVMCTATINDVTPSGYGTNGFGATPDADLQGVLTQIGSSSTVTNDRAKIEFTFLATSDSIKFNYVFGSHEYPTYTCSQFNDVFGFFLTGYDINGNTGYSTVNLATIPGTATPVAINTINQGFPGSSGTASNCLTANPNYVANSAYYNASNGSITSLGGYTDKFTAEAQVKCGNLYHIKLAIANVSDEQLNSAVFLEARSFKPASLTFTPMPNLGNSFSDSMMVEGCSSTAFIIDKSGPYKNKNTTVIFKKMGDAIEGVDYSPIPDTLMIPYNKNSDTIYIQAYDDKIPELNESVILNMTQLTDSCSYSVKTTKVLYIKDKDSLKAELTFDPSLSDTIVSCPGDSVVLTTSTQGGDGYIYSWWQDDSLAAANRYVKPEVTTTYRYITTDECFTDSVVNDITVVVLPYDSIQTTTNYVESCEGESTTIWAEYSGGRKDLTLTWKSGIQDDTIQVTPVNDSTWYTYGLVDQCGFKARDSVLVYFKPNPTIDFDNQPSEGDPLTVIFNSITDTSHVVSYEWDFGDQQSSTDKNPQHEYATAGSYDVTLTLLTDEGCYITITKTIDVQDVFKVFIPTAFTPNGDGINDRFIVAGRGIEKYSITIFNRWGGEVFHSDDIDKSWDGTYNGTKVPEGIYNYTVIAESSLGKYFKQKGFFTIFY